MKISKRDNIYVLSSESLYIYFDYYRFGVAESFVYLYFRSCIVSILEDDLAKQFKNSIDTVNS